MIDFSKAKKLFLREAEKRVSVAEAALDRKIEATSLKGHEELKVPVNYKKLNIKEFNMLLERYVKAGYYYTFVATSSTSPNYIILSWKEDNPQKDTSNEDTHLSFKVTDTKISSCSC